MKRQGFTLVEVMLGSAILVVIVAMVAGILTMAATSIGRIRVSQTAQSLLTARLEQTRNMPYTVLGTVGGVPDGNLPATEAVVVNGQTYTLTTTIIYVDDAFDGLAPTDETPTDYKRIRVTAEWGGIFKSQKPLSMWTDIASKGIETVADRGTISVQVFDAQGVGVPNALVHLEAPTATPSVNLNVTTDTNGKVSLPGAPLCDSCYMVTVTKPGFTIDRTYAYSEVANPLQPPLSVLEGQVTEASFAIDRPSSLTVRVVRTNYLPFTAVQLTLTGKKLIGRTTSDQPVYKLSQNVVSGFGGVATVSNLEWDEYTVTTPGGSSVEFAGSTPFTPFSLIPGSSQSLTVVVSNATNDSLLVRINDNNLNPVASASVTLKNDAASFIATKAAALAGLADGGQAYFGSLPSTLSPFQVFISSAGFLPTTTEATVSGDTVEDFVLIPE